MNYCATVAVVLCLASPALLAAQAAPPSAVVAGPPVRILGAASAVTTEQIGLTPTQMQVRGLPGGRVLLNDAGRRRLLLLDSNMKVIKVVLDSAPVLGTAYGVGVGKLLAYRGDSSLLMETGTLSMLLIDGEGNVIRVKAIPRAEHLSYFASSSTLYGNAGFDAQGRLIYRISDPSTSLSLALGGGVVVPTQPDSAPVLRLNMETRRLDTAGRVKIQKRTTIATQTPTGGISMRTTTNPMPVTDDWTVTSDGSLALLRHRDYSIDWLRPDGRWESTPPMPFDWQRLTDEHKMAFVDSIRTQLENSRRMIPTRSDSINHICFNMERTLGPPIAREIRDSVQSASKVAREAMQAAGAASRSGRGAPAGAVVQTANGVTVVSGGAATTGGRSATPPASAARGTPAPPPEPVRITAPPCPISPYPVSIINQPPPTVISYTELPDYKPPFGANSMRSDADGNVWIRVNQMKPVAGTYLYDIVNSQGRLIDRIQMPTSRTLMGFGPGSVVYVITRTVTPEQPATVKLERVRWRN